MPAADRPTGLQRFVRAVGWTSVGLGAVATVAPRGLARRAGVLEVDAQDALPVLVRLNAARQVSLGLALLTRSPVDVGRSARLFLPLTALDAVAVADGVRRGVLARRTVVMSLTVLATNAGVWWAARRDA